MEGRLPKGYFLKVKSINDSHEYCEIMDFMEDINNTMTSWAVVPPEVTNVKNDPRVMQECCYNIRVESQPYDGRRAAEVNYTIPERVGEVWSCRRKAQLPVPRDVQVSVIDSSTAHVSWTLDASAARIARNISLTLGRQVVSSLLDWFEYESEVLLAVANWSGGGGGALRMEHLLKGNLRRPAQYLVQVRVVDRRDCRGPPAEKRFSTFVNVTTTTRRAPALRSSSTTETPPGTAILSPGGQQQWTTADLFNQTLTPANESLADPNARSKVELVLVVVLPTVSFVVAAALAAAMMYQRCGCAGWLRRKLGEGRLRPVYSCRGVYKAVSIDSSSSRITRVSFPALQERSILYVEKEIEEAKARGEVDTFEVSYERLQLGRQIGKGDFGRVFLARAEAVGGVPGWRTVAVKKLKLRATAEEVEEFQAEIAMLKHAGRHPNVVEMVGCCTLRPPLCILMEFVPCGDLLHYLRRLRVEYERRTGAPLPFSSTRARPAPKFIDIQVCFVDSESSYVQPDPRLSFSSSGRPSIAETEWSLVSSEGGAPSTPTERSPCPGRPGHGLDYVLDPAELQSFAVQIARGMAHLEQRHITHRDLAARNILIDEHKTLKISDFGLSRSGIYVNTRGKKVPLRWLSVEAIRDNLYSSKSDVWAYAIVLWEIGTLGGFPYPTVSDHDLLRFLLEGRRLEKPDNCTDELYSLMMMCWSHNADDRPSFATISKHLEGALGRRPVYVDFSNLRPDYTFPPTEQQQQHQQQQQQRPSFRM
ncbi:uncharacterized protein LOC126252171 [Schistocerca nitens]|uniref:uncharacterized protein LOC126252171 n=1 Tax=Schistocerca nitens TaxID=7011 RepID=UPI002118740D|nr:uncharacterized protein LOC126252171 [Schistocerca nitens]